MSFSVTFTKSIITIKLFVINVILLQLKVIKTCLDRYFITKLMVDCPNNIKINKIKGKNNVICCC